MTRVEFHAAVEKDLKRLPKQFVNYILGTVAGQLEQDELRMEPLKGILYSLHKVRVRYQGVSYRVIVYRIRPGVLKIIMVAKRGDVYHRLKQRLR